MIKIDVDFNARARNGLVRFSCRRADGVVNVGDTVMVFDASEDGMDYLAVVEDLDDSGRGFVRVKWERTSPDLPWQLPPAKIMTFTQETSSTAPPAAALGRPAPSHLPWRPPTSTELSTVSRNE